jgi:hypothetical protein
MGCESVRCHISSHLEETCNQNNFKKLNYQRLYDELGKLKNNSSCFKKIQTVLNRVGYDEIDEVLINVFN